MEKTPSELRETFWAEDLAHGGLIASQYTKIKEVIAKNDKSWVAKKFREIKRHAILQTEFYKNYKEDDCFPVVNKLSILENYEKHKARSGFDLPLHISSTSGSTGTPFSVIQDHRKRMRNIADLQVFGELCDFPIRERMVFFRVLSEKLNRTKEQEEKENIFYVDSSDLSESHLEEMTQILLEKKPRIVFSYSSTLVELAKHIEKSGISADVFSMKSILGGGEGIAPNDRVLLEKVFGCKVYRRYSDMELGILGQDSGDGGNYRLNYGSYYFECLKLENDEPAEYGEVGRIVVTDLFNYAFPMIRYDTGDLGIMELIDENAFPVFKEIYGRKRDCIYTTKGDLLSPAKISVAMWGMKAVKQWQFIQENEKEYTIKINAEDSVDVNGIITKLKNIVGEDAEITAEFFEGVPILSSNKQRAVVCNYIKKG